MKKKVEDIPQNADGTYTVEIDEEIYEKLEKLIYDRERRKEETKDSPIVDTTTGIEYANMEEFRKLSGRSLML